MTLSARLFLISFLLLCYCSSAKIASALAVSCEFVASETTVNLGATSTVTVSLNNSIDSDVVAVRLTNPDSSFLQFAEGTTDGWSASIEGNDITFSGNTLQAGNSGSFSIQVTGLAVTEDVLQIDGYMSSDGSNFDQCSGSSGISVVIPSVVSTSTPTPTSSSSTSTATTRTVTATPTPTPKPLVDTVAPSVSVHTDFSKPFAKAPTITGKASDGGAINVGVAKIEYSTDDGANWSPVDQITSQGSVSTSFNFTPPVLDDGNYKIKVRAKDASGNTGVSKTYEMVIDRLPPQVGGILFSIGPQALLPNKDGVLIGLEGLSAKMTFSVIGGPISVNLVTDNGKKYSASKNTNNGLWSSVFNFSQSGVYALKADSLDGANNKTQRSLNSILILPAGKVLDSLDKSPVKNAKLSVFVFDNITQSYVLWDGPSYMQDNPQETDAFGKYRLFLPSGKYYLLVQAPKYIPLKTDIFILEQSLPVNTNFYLDKARVFKLGPWELLLPSFAQKEVAVSIEAPQVPSDARIQTNLKGKPFPSFKLNLSGQNISENFLRGKKTIVSILNTWLPQTADQLKELDELAKDSQLRVLVLIPHESVSKVNIFKKTGGYKVEMLADPDGTLTEALNLQTLPGHFFLDKSGTIRQIRNGILNEQTIRDILNTY